MEDATDAAEELQNFCRKRGLEEKKAMNAALAENGLVFVNTSVDGAGSCFLYNTEKSKSKQCGR